jgi:serralysin
MNKNVLYFNSLFKKKFAFLAFFLFMTGSFFAQTLDNATATGSEILMRIQGTGVSLSDPVFPFPGNFANQYGTFSNGLSGNLDIKDGVIFTTGSTQSTFVDPSRNSYDMQISNDYSDPDLNALKTFGSAKPDKNPAILEFKLRTGPKVNKVIITYQFASEEYPYYVCSKFNDVFGLFIKGGSFGSVYTNIAKLPTGEVVSINTVHAINNTNTNSPCGDDITNNPGNLDSNVNIDHTNSVYYTNNNASKPFAGSFGNVNIIFDGLTKLITSVIPNLTPNTDYTFKIAIADTGDEEFDSAVFINEIRGLATNFDGDTVIDDAVDLDDDNDGVLDTVESNGFNPDGDEDGDSLPNYMDILDDTPLNGDQGLTNYADVNGDAKPDAYDADNDGIPNHLDLDSDGDGCMDVNEQFASLTIDGDDNGFYGTGIPIVDAQGRVQAVVDRTDISYTSLLNSRVQTSGVFSITSQPYDSNIAAGGEAIFSLASTAVNPIYKWQQSVDNGVNWTDLSDGGTSPVISGSNTIQLHINNVPSTYIGYMYRVLVTTVDYSCYVKSTNTAKLTVGSGPLITSDGGGQNAPISINENTTAVTTVVAVDVDVPTTQTLSYRITGGADASKFTIDSRTGVLVFNTAPNFETPTDMGADNIYNVQVTVTDNGAAPLSDIQDIEVTVLNVNEAPVITSNGGGLSTQISVPEKTIAVTTVTAIDSDLPAQTLVYSIGGVDASKFTIDSRTGVLVFKTAPIFGTPTDVGADNIYNVQVKVTDNGVTLLSDIQDVEVIVTNVNVAPVITSNGGGLTAPINMSENKTVVTTVKATDSNLPAQTLKYSITGGADASKFDINPDTGVLVFKAAPDFETPTDVGTNNVYNVEVTVTDNGVTPLTDVQEVIVTVANVNEAPVIKSNGGGSTALIDVHENTTLVTTVTAIDSDLPSQGLTFSISGGVDASKFMIFMVNSSTAVLVFKERPNFENPADAGLNNVYNVQVKVTDSGGATAVQNIAITVVNVNEAPVAVKNSEVTDENVSVTLNVCTNDSDVDGSIDVATVDLDPNTAGIQTSLTTAEGKWSVDNLGIVTFTPALDFVGTSTIFYTVKDNLGMVSNTAEIAVVVNDVPVVKKPGIALIKTAEFNDLNGDESANIGETITYSFVVTNTGDFPLTNIKVTDPLSGIAMPNAEITLNVGESDSTTFTATYALTHDDIVRGNVTNQATVVGTSTDGTIVKDLSDDSSILGNNPTVTPVTGCSIKVFNALTPEGQNKNKVLYIRGIECYPDNRLEVYNRWGVLVYEGEHYNNVDNVFEGISKGRVTIGASQVLPVGTYYYSLKYKDNNANTYEKSGYLYLNRD